MKLASPPVSIRRKGHTELAVLTGQAYAEAYRARCGRYPLWVPTRGVYPFGRKWARSFLGEPE